SMNEFEGTIQNDSHVRIDLGVVQCGAPNGPGAEVVVAIRPEDISLSSEPSGLPNEFSARLVSRLFLGDITVYHLTAGGKTMRGKTTTNDRRLEAGGKNFLRVPLDKDKGFPKQVLRRTRSSGHSLVTSPIIRSHWPRVGQRILKTLLDKGHCGGLESERIF